MDILKNKWGKGVALGLAVYFGFPFIGLGAFNVLGAAVVAGVVFLKD